MFEKISLYLRNVPKNPETVFEPFSQEMQRLLGDDLLSVGVFGSASSGDYVYGHSDINMVLVMRDLGVGHLKRLCLPIEKWMTRGFSAPRIFIPEDFSRSLDVFPLLFLDIRDNHKILFGTDPFADLKIDPGLLRLQVEQMLKQKVAEARTEFLKSGESLKTFESMISQSFRELFPLLRGMLVLTGRKPSIRKEVVVAMAEEAFELSGAVFTDALRHKNGMVPLSDKFNLIEYFDRYLAAVEKLARAADALETPSEPQAKPVGGN